jgi:hypothetical protein
MWVWFNELWSFSRQAGAGRCIVEEVLNRDGIDKITFLARLMIAKQFLYD